jgi:hypothetical protein
MQILGGRLVGEAEEVLFTSRYRLVALQRSMGAKITPLASQLISSTPRAAPFPVECR